MPVKRPKDISKEIYLSPGDFLENIELVTQLEIAPLTFGEANLMGSLMGMMVLGGSHFDFGTIEGTLTIRKDARGRIYVYLRKVYTGKHTSFSLPKSKQEQLLAYLRKEKVEMAKENGAPLYTPDL
jgi:hypothetical protein